MHNPNPEGLGAEVRELLLFMRDAHEPSTREHVRVLERLELYLAKAVREALTPVDARRAKAGSSPALRGPVR